MILVEKTPFIFEDGETYYFEIRRRSHGMGTYSESYNDLFLFRKVTKKTVTKNWWFSKEVTTYEEVFNQIHKEPVLVQIPHDTKNIKDKIKDKLLATSASHNLKDWDGFVGNIPEDAKKMLSRESKLNDLFG